MIWVTFMRSFLCVRASVISHCKVVLHRTHFHVSQPRYSFVFRSRNAFPMTETELRLIAAPASIGLSSRPKNG